MKSFLIDLSRVAAAATLVVGASCGPASAEPAPARPPEQSLRQAFELWCHVDERAGLTTMTDPLERSQRRSDWLNDNVKNPDAIYMKTMLSVKSQADQATELRAQANKAGVTNCPYADSLRHEAL
jgi:hypothetical protein